MAFVLPPNLAQRICAGASLGFECDANGLVTSGFETSWGGAPYPPPGYLPWNRMEVGNGDTFGFYWPIGRESEPPIVCTLMHDSHELHPLASSFESAIRLHVTAGLQCDDWLELADEFGIAVEGCSSTGEDLSHLSMTGVPYWGVDRAAELLPLDPKSPPLLLRRAQELWNSKKPDIDAAERVIFMALDVLPEYTAAWWELAKLRRRWSTSPMDLLEAVVNCLTSPLAFGHFDSVKCLEWLKRLPIEGTDPLLRHRDRLSFTEAAAGDYAVYDEAIEEYHAQGLSVRALRLRVLYGELIAAETENFRQRSNFSWQKYWDRLRDDCRRAGLDARIDALCKVEPS
jgi:hypothetical protein